jgi:hypothetical protein
MKSITRRKQWRCFHCDEVFRSRKAAWAHFGPDQDCEKLPPACVDPLRHDEKLRLTELREAQQYAFECQESASRSDDRADETERELAEFKSITGCATLHQLRMWMDSQQGRVATANALIEGFRQHAPEILAEIVG